jgi:hypothetical protein
MQKKIILLLLLLTAAAAINAQSSVKGIAVNGVTGLITTPTARIGWEKSDIGIDVGYSYLGGDNANNSTHVPRVTVSLFRMAEIAGAYAMGETDGGMMLNGKFQFFKDGGSAIALGLDYSNYDRDTKNDNDLLESLLRPYIVATYSGTFFKAPAVTSMTFGWVMDDGDSDGLDFNVFNYSMGFELSLFPGTFKNFIYWMNDFSNYNFSAYRGASTVNAGSRGMFNTGLRIDPLKDSEYKFIIDIVGTDLLDPNRGFMLAATFGFAL